jgi:hypothetical protein
VSEKCFGIFFKIKFFLYLKSFPTFRTFAMINYFFILSLLIAVCSADPCVLPAQGTQFDYNTVPKGTYTFELQSYVVRLPPVVTIQTAFATGPPKTLIFYHNPGQDWIATYGQTQFVLVNGSYVFNPATSTKPASCFLRDGTGGSDFWNITNQYEAAARLQFLEADGEGVAPREDEDSTPAPTHCPRRLRWFGLTRDVGAGNQDFASLIYTDSHNNRTTKFSFSQYIYEGEWVLVSGVYTASAFDPRLPAGYNQLPPECTDGSAQPYNPTFAPDAVLAPGSPPIPAQVLKFV